MIFHFHFTAVLSFLEAACLFKFSVVVLFQWRFPQILVLLLLIKCLWILYLFFSLEIYFYFCRSDHLCSWDFIVPAVWFQFLFPKPSLVTEKHRVRYWEVSCDGFYLRCLGAASLLWVKRQGVPTHLGRHSIQHPTSACG